MEENEVFNNRFDGICLATGVEPQLSSKYSFTHLPHPFSLLLLFCYTDRLSPSPPSDNKVHGNRREVEKAIDSCRCLFQVSGNTCYPMHDFYRCVNYMFFPLPCMVLVSLIYVTFFAVFCHWITLLEEAYLLVSSLSKFTVKSALALPLDKVLINF